MSWLSIIPRGGLHARDVAALQGQAGEAAAAAADAGEHLESAASFDPRVRQELELLWRRTDKVGRLAIQEVLRLMNLKGWHIGQAMTYADRAWDAARNVAATCERHLNREQAS